METVYKKLLGTGSNLSVNKFLIKNVGLEAGFLFASLIDLENYLLLNGKVDKDGCFYVGRDSLESLTTLSAHKQKQAEKVLIEAGLIEIKLKGVPAKNSYRLSDQVLKIFKIWMSKNLRTRSEKTSEHIIYNNTKHNNTKHNNKKKKKENEFNQIIKSYGFDPMIVDLLNEYINTRKEAGFPLKTSAGLKRNLNILKNEKALEGQKMILEKSIKNEYRGLFGLTKSDRITVSQNLNENFNKNVAEETKDLPQKAKILVIDPFYFDTPEAYERALDNKISEGYEIKVSPEQMALAKEKWGIEGPQTAKTSQPSQNKNLNRFLPKGFKFKKPTFRSV